MAAEITEQLVLDRLHQFFPMETPREEQKAAFSALAPWIVDLFKLKFRPNFFGCDAPTGVGKAAIAVTAAQAINSLLVEFGADLEISGGRYPVWIVTQNKILQDQYVRDFPDRVFDLRGLDNYACYHDPGKTCGQSKCARLRPPKGMTNWKPPTYCARDCEYDERMKDARFKPVLSLNVAKAFALLKHPDFPQPSMIIFDEGHNVENALDSEASISIDPKTLGYMQYQFEKYFQNLEDIDETIKGLKRLFEDLVDDLAVEAGQSPGSRDPKRYRRLDLMVTKIRDVLDEVDMGLQYVTCSLEKVDLRPIQVHTKFKQVFRFPTLFLSATLLSQRGFCSMTGLQEDELRWFSVSSPFPKENRAMYNFWRMGSPPINYANQQKELENVILRCTEIFQKHPEEKGIIHSHTYRTAEALYTSLYPKFSSRLLFPKNSMEQKEILAVHGKSRNTVLISPSMTEGVDLKDDLCRFSCLCKVPYLPTNDPVVKARMALDSEWYAYRTAMTIVQAPGRGIRSMTDHCVTYFLDPAFQGFLNRSKHLFPRWFLESYQKGTHGKFA